MTTFDLHEHRRVRNGQLEREVEFLRGERDRYELLLAILLSMAARTTGCDPALIFDACCTIADTDPAKAHQPDHPAVDPRHELAA